MNDMEYARQEIRDVYASHPKLFPGEMVQGFAFHGNTRVSKKLGIKQRRVRIGNDIYCIRPSFVMPAMRCTTDLASQALFLLRFGVPFWALAVVFGKNAMFWYRCFVGLSGGNLVSTTVYDPACLPNDLLADEHHIKLCGKKAYVATTVSAGCILGTEVSAKADEDALTDAYQVFQQEVTQIEPTYAPATVNTDGWAATKRAWKNLFPTVLIIECFLHAWLKIRDRATKQL